MIKILMKINIIHNIMLYFTDRLINRLRIDNIIISARDELVSYFNDNRSWKEELKQIAKEKFELAITKIYLILTYEKRV